MDKPLPETNPTNSIVTREGPTFTDYMVDFFQFLHRRTNFRLNHFTMPHELRNKLSQMEMLQVPQSLWKYGLNLATQMVARMDNITRADIAVLLITAAVEVILYYLDFYSLGITILTLGWTNRTSLKTIIVAVYHFFVWAITKVVRIVETKIKLYATKCLQPPVIVQGITST